jgi:putative transposase
MTYWLPAMKETFAFLKDSPSQTLQQVTTDLAFAYKHFFAGRADFPKFKKKGKSGDSFRFPQGFKLEPHNNRVFLPKLGWIRYRNSRDVVGTMKNITVSCTNGQWFASMQTEQEVAQPLPTATDAVGIDVGIARFATLSDGTFIAPVNSFKQHQLKLARYQRSMSRKVKFSKNWQKARQKVSKTHARIANLRRDFLHKTSTIISKNHAMIFVEDLKVANMSKSAKGTAAKPGRKVRQKAGLNRSILDQGWSEFRRQLEYKQAWNGGWLDAVPPQYTSQECPCCGHTAKDNRKTQAHFVCMDCGFAEHADLVGAINIRRAGLARLACGDTLREVGASAQESTEDTRQLLAA